MAGISPWSSGSQSAALDVLPTCANVGCCEPPATVSLLVAGGAPPPPPPPPPPPAGGAPPAGAAGAGAADTGAAKPYAQAGGPLGAAVGLLDWFVTTWRADPPHALTRTQPTMIFR